MENALLLLIVQGTLGATDTLLYHELKARLPSTPAARLELRLHAARDFIYAVIFGSLGWMTWSGAWAWVLSGLLLAEIVITLWDFVEEDRTRRLAAGERVMHAVMAIVYGAFLAFLVPRIGEWAARPTGLEPVDHGLLSWLMSAMAVGVFLSGVRDVVASFLLPMARR